MKKSTKIIIIVAAVVAALAIALTVTLVCVLREDPSVTYTVTFNSNGGTEVASIKDVPHNSKIAEPTAPTRLGYSFAGWYKESATENLWRFNWDRVKSDITLYAKWNYDASEGLAMELVAGAQYTVTGIGSVADEVVVIPSSYNGLPVTAIAREAFKNNSNVTAIVIPDSVVSIGDRVFENCSALVNAVMPNRLNTFGSYVFYRCVSLTSINLPSNITAIPAYSFYECESLVKIEFPASLKVIGQGAFYDCKQLQNFVFPTNLETIGDNAFSGCRSITGVTVTINVKSIGVNAFSGCVKIDTLNVVPGNRYYYSEGNCIIQIVEINKNKVVVGCKSSVIPTDGTVSAIGEGAFQGCQGLARIAGPSNANGLAGIRKIENNAFSGCSSLKNVIIPATIESIGDGAFGDCISLETLSFSDRDKSVLTTIGREAFYNCAITSVTLPTSIRTIGVGAFWGYDIRLQYAGTTRAWSQVVVCSDVNNVIDGVAAQDREDYGDGRVNVFCLESGEGASVPALYLAYNQNNI